MPSRPILPLIAIHRGEAEAQAYAGFSLVDTKVLADTAIDLLKYVPRSFGACAMLSAGWVSYLRNHHDVPAVVVAGDLQVNGVLVFKCESNVPTHGAAGQVTTHEWDGHCWIEIDGYVGDVSIFRTAYSIQGPSHLKSFVLSTFGSGRGVLIDRPGSLEASGMIYTPRFILDDHQVEVLVAGLGELVTNDG